MTTSATPTRLVSIGLHGPILQLLSAATLDERSGDTELTDAGFRLAEFPNTGACLLVRPTGIVPKWCAAWESMAYRVDAHRINTGVRFDQGGEAFSIVVELGERFPGQKLWTRHDNVEAFSVSAIQGGKGSPDDLPPFLPFRD